MTSAISDPPQHVQLETTHAPLDGATDVVLRDGSTVLVRPAVADDVEAVATFLDGLSPDARWFRFLGGGISAVRAARGLIDHGVGLVATAGVDGHVVAHACLVPEPNGERAELAFAVADAWQGRGIGTLMLAHLAQLAEAAGVVTLTAFVHPDNHRMLAVLRDPRPRLGYVYMHNMGWGWAILMTIASLATLGLLVGVVLTAARDHGGPSPREILDRRLAAGEIDLDEYGRARAAMSREGSDGSPAGPPTPA